MTTLAVNLQTGRHLVSRGVLAAWAAVALGSLPIWPFGWHLGLHVLGAVLLIGNAAAMAVWLSVAGFAGGDAAKRRAASAVNRADLWFTIPGVALLLANGLAMVAARYGGATAFGTTPWIAAGLVLLVSTGLVWAVRLVPAQLEMLRIAQASGDLDRPAFRNALIRWSVWGSVATVLPIVAVVLMTAKPTF